MLNMNFQPFPILKTQRLVLRQLSTDDKQNIFALRSDEAINKYLDRTPSKTIDDAMHFINTVNENIQKNNSVYWAITLTGTNEFVGTVCLFDFSTESNKCEIGYELLTNFQGRGIMKEGVEKAIEYAFNKINVQTIIAFTHKDNSSSTKLLEKLNFIKSLGADNENGELDVFTLTKSRENI
jgi:[ribosomal protein S5]-alanine N-acetyltransferase